MAFELPSFAKINWTLRVLGKRRDGFHELCTLFQTVSLCDTLAFEEGDELELTCDDPRIPTDESNLIVKAVRALQDAIPSVRGRGARIQLTKRIPSPGGLGGGSSNAAVALIGLCRLWEVDRPDELPEIAASLGSDVPYFLVGGTALGTGRGDKIEPLPDVGADNLLIVTPDVAISTGSIFGSTGLPILTEDELVRKLTVCRNEAPGFSLRRSELKNDLEGAVAARFPEVERVKAALVELGASVAAMSGSGASVFAVFDKQETRQAVIKALGGESTWRVFAVSTISRAVYREALGL